MQGTVRQRLFNKLTVDLDGPRLVDGAQCWIWTGRRTPQGYGTIRIKDSMRAVHRIAWELERGPVPAGLQLDHLCRVRLCANVAHLEPVTPRENILRGEGLPAQQVKRTHCPRGHPYDEENTYRNRGRRSCRTCARAYQKNWYQQHKRI